LYDNKAPFAIANLDYIIRQSTVYPYQDWLKMAPGAKLAKGLSYLQKKGIWVNRVADARSEIALARRNPQKMGFYGIISVGFCVAVLIMIIGFLLYTFISLQSRLLQFGVLRAIGLSLRQLIEMLCLEQLWSVGIGLLAGTIIGEAISMIFVPFLQSSAAFSNTVPPFSVIISGIDIWSIYEAILPVLLISLVILAYILTRLQVHQAVKLGEEG
jgi:putative ABC transport system permease protein